MALTALVGGLRFARADVAGTSFFATDNYYTYTTDDGHHLEHLNIDIVSYLSMIEQRRGNDAAAYKMVPYQSFVENGDVLMGPVAPFIYRPALPFVASLLPIDAADSFALVNLVLVVAGTFFMVDALAVQGRSRNAQLIGGLIYAVSLPLLVFTSSLYIDGGAMAVFVIGYWLIARRCWWALALFIPVSYAVKESLVFLVPSVVVAWRSSGRSFKDVRFLIGAPLVALAWAAVVVAVRVTAPTPTYSFSVLPKLNYIVNNLVNRAMLAASNGEWTTLQATYNANVGAMNLYVPGTGGVSQRVGTRIIESTLHYGLSRSRGESRAAGQRTA